MTQQPQVSTHTHTHTQVSTHTSQRFSALDKHHSISAASSMADGLMGNQAGGATTKDRLSASHCTHTHTHTPVSASVLLNLI